MQLQIKPGLRQVWRAPGTVQIGLDTRHGTVLDGLTSADRDLIQRLTVGLDDAALRGSPGPPPDRARELVRLLGDSGVLVRSRAGRAALTRLGTHRDRLAADADVWSVVHPEGDDGWELLAERSCRHLEVIGTGRTGSSLATTLAAAGVGSVRVLDRLPTADDAAAAGAHRPDLIVIIEHAVADAMAADRLLSADIPHLSVVIGEAGVMVGPLVVPGRGPCLRCLELHRADRDPAWPRLLAQLLSTRHVRSPEETSCAALAAGLAGLQALGHLDGRRSPAALGATLEIELPDGLVSRRPWPAHPACGCYWPPAVMPTRPPASQVDDDCLSTERMPV